MIQWFTTPVEADHIVLLNVHFNFIYRLCYNKGCLVATLRHTQLIKAVHAFTSILDLMIIKMKNENQPNKKKKNLN